MKQISIQPDTLLQPVFILPCLKNISRDLHGCSVHHYYQTLYCPTNARKL